MPISHLENLNDQKLYNLCKFYGEQAKKWRYKFMSLLPEVYRRKLYEKKGFSSIFEFAKKLAGLSEEQVRTILNLEKKFEDKPALKQLLIEGEVSVNKLVRIQSVATKENEDFWASQVRILPQKALETLVRDDRMDRKGTKEVVSETTVFGNQNGFYKVNFEDESLRAQTSTPQKISSSNSGMDLQFSNEVCQKLLDLQQKGININELILEMLKKRELRIAQEKEQISSQLNQTNSRYIPVNIKNILHQEHGTKCSIKTCSKAAEDIHHTQRFSLAHVHDPHYLAPLCKQHHIIAHSIDLKFQEKRML